MPPNSRPLRVLISAGEASGEMYGAALIDALRTRVPNLDAFGVGGNRMRAAGFDSVVDAHDVAVVGLAEVITHLPSIWRRFRHLLREIDRRRPDVAVLIDFPDFNFRLAKQLHRRGIPVVYYVSPQLWAWRQGRIKLVQQYVARMLVIFPFEQDFYAGHGVEAQFVGHPLAELSAADRKHSNTIALLPGSRRKEVAMNLPAMVESAALVRRECPDFTFILPVASTLNRAWVQQEVAKHAALPIQLVADARSALANSRAAIVASGTATVEAAVVGTPFVMVYRVSPLTWALGRRLVSVPFYAMVNLIAGREVVPELVQHDFTPQNVANRVKEIIADGSTRQRMMEGLAEVRQKLAAVPAGSPGSVADRAAEAVLEVARRAVNQA